MAKSFQREIQEKKLSTKKNLTKLLHLSPAMQPIYQIVVVLIIYYIKHTVAEKN
jgi:hypothetical protein